MPQIVFLVKQNLLILDWKCFFRAQIFVHVDLVAGFDLGFHVKHNPVAGIGFEFGCLDAGRFRGTL